MAPWADSIASFWAMGGHGLYVWLAYGAAVILLAVNLVSTRSAWRRYRRETAQENEYATNKSIDSPKSDKPEKEQAFTE